jgi:hypothetical protein
VFRQCCAVDVVLDQQGRRDQVGEDFGGGQQPFGERGVRQGQDLGGRRVDRVGHRQGDRAEVAVLAGSDLQRAPDRGADPAHHGRDVAGGDRWVVAAVEDVADQVGGAGVDPVGVDVEGQDPAGAGRQLVVGGDPATAAGLVAARGGQQACGLEPAGGGGDRGFGDPGVARHLRTGDPATAEHLVQNGPVGDLSQQFRAREFAGRVVGCGHWTLAPHGAETYSVLVMEIN